MVEERIALVAMRVEGPRDDGFGPDCLAHPSRQFGFGTGNVPNGHRAVYAQVDTVERTVRAEFRDHLADEGFEGLLGHPSRSGPRSRPQRRLDPDQLGAVFARHLHEAAHVRFRRVLQQRLSAHR
jgi:hypothetical protein